MLKAYSLREKYRQSSLSGMVCLTHAGDAVDLQDALAQGDGEILTDDIYLQSALEQLQGADGLVFEASAITSTGERIPL